MLVRYQPVQSPALSPAVSRMACRSGSKMNRNADLCAACGAGAELLEVVQRGALDAVYDGAAERGSVLFEQVDGGFDLRGCVRIGFREFEKPGVDGFVEDDFPGTHTSDDNA